jgi:hypothetical protein
MGLKKNKSIIGIYGLHQAIQIDCYPLIISLVADSSANTGKFVIFWLAQPNIARKYGVDDFLFLTRRTRLNRPLFRLWR